MKQQRAGAGRYLAVDLAHVDLIRGARRVLRDLCWRIRVGQRWVLQGANGAGKTQLLKLIAGDVWPQPRSHTRRLYHWRGVVSTEPYCVRDEIAYLGAERQDRYQHYDWNYRVSTVVGTGIQRSDTPVRLLTRVEQARISRVLRQLGIQALARRRLLELSQGERRLVLLARALAWRPALLLLDEPLNGLDEPSRARVLSALNTLARSKLPWIYATHRLEEVPAAVTHWARLEHGRLLVGQWRDRRPPPRRGGSVPGAASGVRAAQGEILIELRGATVWRSNRPALRRLKLQICRGECWVVHGANGSGKSTLLGTLYGEFAVANPGSLWRGFHSAAMPLSEMQDLLGWVSPELQAALPRQLTALECTAAALRGAYHLDKAMSGCERRAALHALDAAGAGRFAHLTLGELSYGQARRVVFARAMARHPDMVLLDEPYTGLDLLTRRKLRTLVETWISHGRTVVIATHHRDDWPRGTTCELELAAGVSRYSGPLRRLPAARAGRPP